MDKFIVKLVIKAEDMNQIHKKKISAFNVIYNISQLENETLMNLQNKVNLEYQAFFHCNRLIDYLHFSTNYEWLFSNQQGDKKNFTMNFVFHLNENNFKSLIEEYLCARNKVNNHSSNLIFDTFSESITIIQLLYPHYFQFHSNELSWIHQVYNSYLCNYRNLISNGNFNIFYNYNQIFDLKLYMKDCLSNMALDQKYENLRNYNQITLNNHGPDVNNIQQYNDQNVINDNNNNDNNNNNNVNEEIHADGNNIAAGNNRDWLDIFYMLSRMTILFCIVYFYSSPQRFTIVAFFGYLIYLYHNGHFRRRRALIGNDDHMENNNEMMQNDNDPPIVQNRMINEEVNRSNSSTGINFDNVNNRRRPGVLSLAWIFLSSFFVSLMPEQPNII